MLLDSIWLIIATATIIQGFILSIAIYFKSAKTGNTNVLLSVFIFAVSFSMIGRVTHLVPSVKWALFYAIVTDALIFSYGPISFFYLQSLFNRKYKSWTKYIPHAIPLMIFLTRILYETLFRNHFNNSILGQNITYVHFALELIAILSNAFYLYLGNKQIREYQKEASNKLSYLPQLKYIKFFIGAISITIVIWTIGFISKYNINFQTNSVFSYNIVWIIISCLTFTYAYLSFFESGIIALPKKVGKYEQGYLGDEHYIALKNDLEILIKEKEPFLNPKLTLIELSKSMNVNQRDLSRVINQFYKVNFFEFINNCRLEKFKNLIKAQKDNNFTIISLAYEAGFNSKATFNSVFKKNMKCTPTEFIKKNNI